MNDTKLIQLFAVIFCLFDGEQQAFLLFDLGLKDPWTNNRLTGVKLPRQMRTKAGVVSCIEWMFCLQTLVAFRRPAVVDATSGMEMQLHPALLGGGKRKKLHLWSRAGSYPSCGSSGGAGAEELWLVSSCCSACWSSRKVGGKIV